jgi:class 3 adenylate cyclase
VWVDQRGWGASDRDVDPLSWAGKDATNEQLTAVADAVGSEQFALLAFNILGPGVIRYAANHPDRVNALILFGSFACFVQDDDCPWGVPIDFVDQLPQLVAETWGTGFELDVIAPSRKSDDRLREWLARGERLGATPLVAGRAVRAAYLQDVRDCLSRLRVPTLVVHRRDDPVIPVEAGRYLAEHIDGAKYVELPGADSEFWAGDYHAVIDEIEEFLTGVRSAPEGEVATATVVFTDIVASTAQSARLGHRKWTALTDTHDTMVRSSLAHYRGREIRTTGDGFLATFDATTRAVRAALEIATKARQMGLEVRSGIHIGEVEMRADDIAGLPVSIAKRVCDLANAGEVFVSRPATEMAAGSGITFEDRGQHTLKGVPGTWQLFAAHT